MTGETMTFNAAPKAAAEHEQAIDHLIIDHLIIDHLIIDHLIIDHLIAELKIVQALHAALKLNCHETKYLA